MSFAVYEDFGKFLTLKNQLSHLEKTILNRSRQNEETLLEMIEELVLELTRAIASEHQMKFEYLSTDTWDNFNFDPTVGIIPVGNDCEDRPREIKTVQVSSANEPSLQTFDSFLHTLLCIHELLGSLFGFFVHFLRGIPLLVFLTLI